MKSSTTTQTGNSTAVRHHLASFQDDVFQEKKSGDDISPDSPFWHPSFTATPAESRQLTQPPSNLRKPFVSLATLPPPKNVHFSEQVQKRCFHGFEDPEYGNTELSNFIVGDYGCYKDAPPSDYNDVYHYHDLRLTGILANYTTSAATDAALVPSDQLPQLNPLETAKFLMSGMIKALGITAGVIAVSLLADKISPNNNKRND